MGHALYHGLCHGPHLISWIMSWATPYIMANAFVLLENTSNTCVHKIQLEKKVLYCRAKVLIITSERLSLLPPFPGQDW